jgi:putative DNA primase/helicase
VSNKTPTLVLNELLGSIGKVDFRKMVKQRGGDSEAISRQQKLVCVVDRIMEVAKGDDWGLTRDEEFTYVYNGEYWMLIGKHEFQDFLAHAAYKMGIPKIEARQYQFQEQLIKQFNSSARLPSPVRNPHAVLINLMNGTYEVTHEDYSLKPFNRDHFLTYQLPFNYDPEAKAPIFREYLNRVLPDRELQMVLSEFIGYVFVKGLKLEKCLLLYGQGANGKSVFFEIICAMLGEENVSNFSLSNLSEEHNRALIANKLLNYGSEIRSNIETDIFKQLVSGESVQCRLKYGNSFTIKDYARLMFNCNELPGQVEHNEAFFRRFLIVPFDVTIPERERDPQLAKRIIENELSGVFNWVLEGVERLLINNDFTVSETVNHVLKEYKQESDSVFCFLEENNCKPSNEIYALLKFVYDDYKRFCLGSGLRPIGRSRLKKRLEMLGYVSDRKKDGIIIYITGIK